MIEYEVEAVVVAYRMLVFAVEYFARLGVEDSDYVIAGSAVAAFDGQLSPVES